MLETERHKSERDEGRSGTRSGIGRRTEKGQRFSTFQCSRQEASVKRVLDFLKKWTRDARLRIRQKSQTKFSSRHTPTRLNIFPSRSRFSCWKEHLTTVHFKMIWPWCIDFAIWIPFVLKDRTSEFYRVSVWDFINKKHLTQKRSNWLP